MIDFQLSIYTFVEHDINQMTIQYVQYIFWFSLSFD